MTVTIDNNHRDTWSFKCRKWLDADRFDGRVERSLVARRMDQ